MATETVNTVDVHAEGRGEHGRGEGQGRFSSLRARHGHAGGVEADRAAVRAAQPAAWTLYIAGLCASTQGPGGWAYLGLAGDAPGHRSGAATREESGADPATTEVRMELTAALHALAATAPGSHLCVYTHAQLVAHGLTTHLERWRQRGWQMRGGQPVEAPELWERVAALAAERRVEWQWVRVQVAKVGLDRHSQRVCLLAQVAMKCAIGQAVAASAPVGRTGRAGPGHPGRRGVGLTAASATVLPPAAVSLAADAGTRPAEVATGHSAAAGVTPGCMPPGESVLLSAKGSAMTADEKNPIGAPEMDRPAGTHQAPAAAPSAIPAAVGAPLERAGAPAALPDTDDSRHTLLADAAALERRWAEVTQQLLQLHAEGQRLLEPLTGSATAPGWAEGALLWRALDQYAARLAHLTREARQVCSAYAEMLQRALDT